jgi:uncharacterized small protein (DUF1192 family)
MINVSIFLRKEIDRKKAELASYEENSGQAAGKGL